MAEVVVCPRALEGDAGARRPRADYVEIFENPAAWSNVYAKTDTAKFYLAMLDPRHELSLDRLVAMTQRKPLRVEFEVGGLRFANADAFSDQAGEDQAASELRALKRWTDAGGTIDAIATDHAIMHHLSMNHRDRNEFTGEKVEASEATFTMDALLRELMDYFVAVQKVHPNVRLGVIESLGYFHVKGRGGRVYPTTDPRLPNWDFEEFLDNLLAAAKSRGVTIDFFDIDFGYIGSAVDSRRVKASRLDVGRTRAVMDIVRSKGLQVGLMLNDDGRFDAHYEKNHDRDRNRRAHKNTLAYWETCAKEKARPDRVLIQSWFDVPARTGPETERDSFFYTAAELIDRAPRPGAQP